METDESVTERDSKIDPTGLPKLMGRPQYLLDGQQRITSLHRVFHDHEKAQVVFNIETERFQIQSAATARDPRWVHVFRVLTEPNLIGLVDTLSAALSGMDRNDVAKRLQKLQQIGQYTYHVEIVENMPYVEVTEIFIRVNSRGRSLKSSDLALATLSSRWRGVITELEDERDRWSEFYPAIDLPFLARALAAIATESRTLSGFTAANTEALKDGWQGVKRGIGHLIPLLRNNRGHRNQPSPSVSERLGPTSRLSRYPRRYRRLEVRGRCPYLLAARRLHHRSIQPSGGHGDCPGRPRSAVSWPR